MSGTCSQQLHGWRQRGDSGGGTYSLGPAATIGGNLSIQKIPVSNAFNSICGTTVYGNMQFANNGTAVQMGTTVPVFCAGNTIGRALEVVDNSSSALMFDNSVGSSISVVGNTGPVDVVGNAVGGNLLCQGNADLIMGSGNTARKITGQCNAGAIAAPAQEPADGHPPRPTTLPQDWVLQGCQTRRLVDYDVEDDAWHALAIDCQCEYAACSRRWRKKTMRTPKAINRMLRSQEPVSTADELVTA